MAPDAHVGDTGYRLVDQPPVLHESQPTGALRHQDIATGQKGHAPRMLEPFDHRDDPEIEETRLLQLGLILVVVGKRHGAPRSVRACESQKRRYQNGGLTIASAGSLHQKANVIHASVSRRVTKASRLDSAWRRASSGACAMSQLLPSRDKQDAVSRASAQAGSDCPVTAWLPCLDASWKRCRSTRPR